MAHNRIKAHNNTTMIPIPVTILFSIFIILTFYEISNHEIPGALYISYILFPNNTIMAAMASIFPLLPHRPLV